MTTIELSPGTIIDTDAARAYVMVPEGGVKAVSITDGAKIWQSDAAEKPLVLLGDLLVGQAAPAGAPEGVTVRALRVDENGTVANESSVPMPEGVNPTLEPSAKVGFTLSGAADDGNVILSWEYRERPLRGLPVGDDEVLPGEELPPDGAMPGGVLEAAAEPVSAREETVVRGQVRLRLADGPEIEAIEAPQTEQDFPSVPQFPASRPDIAPGSTLDAARAAAFDPLTFASADGLHRLESRRLESADSVWPVYRWTIYEAQGDTPLGTFDLHLSFAPFLVAAGRLIVELQPYRHLSGGKLHQEPMQLRAYDLSGGDQVWMTPVRDIYYVPEPPH